MLVWFRLHFVFLECCVGEEWPEGSVPSDASEFPCCDKPFPAQGAAAVGHHAQRHMCVCWGVSDGQVSCSRVRTGTSCAASRPRTSCVELYRLEVFSAPKWAVMCFRGALAAPGVLMKFSAAATKACSPGRGRSCLGVLGCGPCAVGEGCMVHRLRKPRCFPVSNPMCWDIEMGRRSSPRRRHRIMRKK